MANVAIGALHALREFLIGPDGLNDKVHAIAVRDMVRIPEIRPEQVAIRHVDADLADRFTPTRYPSILLFCETVENRQESKFRAFSGRVGLVVALRASEHGIRELDLFTARLAEGVMNVLADRRGKWTETCAFDGSFRVEYGPVSRGGVEFLQEARVEIELLASA